MSVSDKKRIGIYLKLLPSAGGSYHYLFFMLDALRCLIEKFDVYGFCQVDIWQEMLSKRYPEIRAEALPKDMDMAIEVMDSYDCEAVIYPMDGADASSSMRLKTPVINVIHDIMCFYDQGFATHRGYDYARMYQMFCRHSIGVFTDSDLGCQQILHVCGHLYQDKVYALPFRPCKYLDEAEPEEALPLKNEKFFFYPANFGYHKNHLNLLLAMDKLKAEGLKVNFLFTGQGQHGAASQIDRLIKGLELEEQVDITGAVSNQQMKYLYKHARAMVMPTFDGPTNIPPVESMFMGCPVAVSNLYAMPWQVGEAGLTFNPDSIEEIASVLRRLWTEDELCQEIRERGFRRMESLNEQSFNQNFAEALGAMLTWPGNMYPHLEALYQFCRGRKVYIYGAGRFGHAAYEYLQHKNVKVAGFVVSGGQSHRGAFLGKPVYIFDDARADMESAAVILALGGGNLEEVQALLDDSRLDKSREYVFDQQHEMEVFSFRMNL